MFQHTAARRRLLVGILIIRPYSKFQHTAARRRLPTATDGGAFDLPVSTHSRPKAAAHRTLCSLSANSGFNTQPPEGGCSYHDTLKTVRASFNTQPPEGGCNAQSRTVGRGVMFQHTAARRRLPSIQKCKALILLVSTHSRPKAAA